MKTGIRLSMIALLVALIAVSCKPLMQSDRWERGALILDFNENNSEKAVFPFDPAFSTIDHYHVVLNGPDGAMETIEDVTSTLMERSDLVAGTWTVNVVAYNKSDNVLGRGMASGEVTATKTTRLHIVILPSGEGTLKVGVTWEGNNLVSDDMAVEGAILLEGQDVFIPIILDRIEKGATYEAKLGSGNYSVLLKLKDSQDRVRWGYVETFHLYEDLSTAKTYSIPAHEMNAAPEKAPVFLKVERGHDRVKLVWDAGSARGERFILERKTSNSDWVRITGEGQYYASGFPYTIMNWTDLNLVESTTYSYRIRSENYFGTSIWSDELIVKTLPVKEVGGLLREDTVWNAETVYHMTTALKVPENIKLTIMPGTKIMIDPSLYIQVDGTLIARGTYESPILLGYASLNWSYIVFTDKSVDANYRNDEYASGSVMQFVTIRGGGRIQVNASRPYLDHLDIDEVNNGAPISVSLNYDMSNSFILTNSKITHWNWEWPINISGDGKFLVENNQITGRYGLYVSSGRRSGSKVERNVIAVENSGMVFESSYSDWNDPLLIQENRISRIYEWNSRNGAGIQLASTHYNTIVSDNSISYKDQGLSLSIYNSYGVKIRNNGIRECNNGLWLDSHNPQAYPAITLEGNLIVDSLSRGQFYNMSPSPLSFASIKNNYFDNPSASFEVYLGDNMKIQEQQVLDLSGNYWYTNDAEAIKLRIRDAGRDFSFGEVKVEPVAILNGLQALPTTPASGVTVTNSKVNFSWMMMGRAKSQRLQISNDASFSTLLVDKQGIAVNSWMLGSEEMPAGIEDGGTYFWRVAGVGANGVQSDWSEVRSFSIALSVPIPAAPIQQDILYDDFSPLFTWQSPADLEACRVMLANDEAFSDVIVNTVISNSSEYELKTDLAGDRTYYWKLIGIDENGIEAKTSSATQVFHLPKPGLMTRVELDLPAVVEISISGPDKVRIWGGEIFFINANVSTQKVRWLINGSEKGYSSSFQWPQLPKGTYFLTAMVQYGERWYSSTRKVSVVSDGGMMP